LSDEGAKEQERLIFTSFAFPGKASETDILLLAESIRAHAGYLSKTPIWCFIPEQGKRLNSTIEDRLLGLDVTLIPFKIDPKLTTFPFLAEAHEAALAESMALGRARFLAWLAANTVVLQEPRDFLLREGRSLGVRPVHHTLVGSRYDGPLDPFWTLIYRHCNVPEDRVFPMTTHVDGMRIRPYFNAGLLVTRPRRRLLRAWRDAFLRAYREPHFQEFYKQDERYMVFIHQAVLSGVILSTLATDEMQELPASYNYPLHLHAQDVTGRRPSTLEELVTFRHEGFYRDPEWMTKMPAKDPLKRWIAERLSLMVYGEG
jgi:hypothetical protein